MCTDFLAISLLGNWLVYLFALRCCRETPSLLFNSHLTSCAWIKTPVCSWRRHKLHANTWKSPHQTLTRGGISSQSHGLKSPIGGENNPEVGEEPVERGQITTSNPKHSAQTRSEAATTIRANPVLRVSQRGETLLTVSLLSVRPRRARLAEQILTRDTEPCAGTGMRRYAPATREAFTCERSWGSDRFITASPGVKSLQNNWFTLTQDFRRGEAFLRVTVNREFNKKKIKKYHNFSVDAGEAYLGKVIQSPLEQLLHTLCIHCVCASLCAQQQHKLSTSLESARSSDREVSHTHGPLRPSVRGEDPAFRGAQTAQQ